MHWETGWAEYKASDRLLRGEEEEEELQEWGAEGESSKASLPVGWWWGEKGIEIGSSRSFFDGDDIDMGRC
jgi:hypothetical protein